MTNANVYGAVMIAMPLWEFTQFHNSCNCHLSKDRGQWAAINTMAGAN